MSLLTNLCCGDDNMVRPYVMDIETDGSTEKRNKPLPLDFPMPLPAAVVKIIGEYSISSDLFHKVMDNETTLGTRMNNFLKIIFQDQKSLNLENYPVTFSNIQDIVLFYPILEELTISCANLDDKSILKISELTSITTLTLTTFGKISDPTALRQILKQMSNLTTLKVSGLYKMPTFSNDVLGTTEILIQARAAEMDRVAKELFAQHPFLTTFRFEEMTFNRRRTSQAMNP